MNGAHWAKMDRIFHFGEHLKTAYNHKDQSEKKVTNVDAYISVNFSHMITNLVTQKMQILPAFQRGILCNCVFTMIRTTTIILKLAKNLNIHQILQTL